MASGDLTATNQTYSSKKGAVFDGVDDNVTFTPVPGMTGNSDLSISLWFYMGSTDIAVILSQTDAGGRISISVTGGTQIKSGYYDTSSWVGADVGGLSLGTWYHYMLVKTGIGVVGYLNGSLVGGTSTPSSNVTAGFKIGTDTLGANDFTGSISDVKIWNRALSSTEAAQDYAGHAPTTNLIHRWKLQEDYKDSVGSNDGTNAGSYLTNTLPNQVMADVGGVNLAATTDKVFCLAVEGRGNRIKTFGVNRAV